MSEAKCSCSAGPKLIFACSGASDVGEVADRTARRLTREGLGRMFCLSGIGGRVDGILKTTRTAQSILAIDGCALACARGCLEQAGFKGFAHLQLGEIGMEKGTTPVTDDAIARSFESARGLLAG